MQFVPCLWKQRNGQTNGGIRPTYAPHVVLAGAAPARDAARERVAAADLRRGDEWIADEAQDAAAGRGAGPELVGDI